MPQNKKAWRLKISKGNGFFFKQKQNNGVFVQTRKDKNKVP